jgi:hypothetical protein
VIRLAPKLQHSLSAVILGIYLVCWKITIMKNFLYFALDKIEKLTSLSSKKHDRNSKNARLSVAFVKAVVYRQAFILPVVQKFLQHYL